MWDTTFRIFSDYKALEILAKVAKRNPRVQRWLEFLTAYCYTLEYRKGSANGTPTFYLGYRCLRRRMPAATAAA